MSDTAEAPVKEQDVETTEEAILDVDAVLADYDIELDDEDDDEGSEANKPFVKHEEGEMIALGVADGKVKQRYVKVSIACWVDEDGNPFVKTRITMRKSEKSSYKTEKVITTVYPAVKALADQCRRMFEMRLTSKLSD
jgi:hypothetical protein